MSSPCADPPPMGLPLSLAAFSLHRISSPPHGSASSESSDGAVSLPSLSGLSGSLSNQVRLAADVRCTRYFALQVPDTPLRCCCPALRRRAPPTRRASTCLLTHTAPRMQIRLRVSAAQRSWAQPAKLAPWLAAGVAGGRATAAYVRHRPAIWLAREVSARSWARSAPLRRCSSCRD